MTAPTEEEFDFATGTAESKKEAEKNRPIFADSLLRPDFVKLTEAEPKCIVRFLDDEKRDEKDRRKNLFIGIQEHAFVKGVPKPESFTSDNWNADTKGRSAVCRRDRAFKAYYSDCYICANELPDVYDKKGKFASPSQRVYARVVMREKYDLGDGSGKKGIRDVMKKVKQVDDNGKVTGEEILVPDIRLLAGSQKTLFQNLTGIAQANYDDDGEFTILHGDFRITRTGFGLNDTAYTIAMVPGTDRIPAGELATEEYPFWDCNNPAVLKHYTDQCPWTLRGHLISLASDEHYNRWFIPGGWDIEEAKRKAAREGDDEAPADKPAKSAKPEKTEKPAPAAAPSIDDDDDDDVASGPPAAASAAGAVDEDDAADASPAQRRLSDIKEGYRSRMSAGDPPPRRDSAEAATVDDEDDYANV